MQKKLIWAFDCDDVVVSTAQLLISAYNERYGMRLGLDAMYTDNTTGVWGEISDQEAINRVAILLHDGVIDDVAPSQEMVKALSKLKAMGDELHMVTGRQSYLEGITRKMIDHYLPNVFSSVEFTNYYLEEGSGLASRTKGEVCMQIKADVLVDDHIVHGSDVLAHGVKEVIVWGDFPWNHDQTLESGMVRCLNVSELFRERERILAA